MRLEHLLSGRPRRSGDPPEAIPNGKRLGDAQNRFNMKVQRDRILEAVDKQETFLETFRQETADLTHKRNSLS